MSRCLVGILGFTIAVAAVAGVAAQAESVAIDLALSFENLEPLSSGHYEGWLLVDGKPVTTGKFLISEGGQIRDLSGNAEGSFRVAGVGLSKATKFVLTIEPAGDSDSVPAAVKPLAGDLSQDKRSAELIVNLGAASNGPFKGVFVLATPSDAATDNERAGVWFLDRSGVAPVAGLDVPDLSGSDWTYEGWAVINGAKISTGRFDKPEGADDAALYSGPLPAPPFPGEDFLQNAPGGSTFPPDLRGATIVLSIEPREDDDPGPFQFKPLVGVVPQDAQDHQEYPLEDRSASFPTGTVEITEVVTEAAPPLVPEKRTPFPAGALVVAALAAAALLVARRVR